MLVDINCLDGTSTSPTRITRSNSRDGHTNRRLRSTFDPKLFPRRVECDVRHPTPNPRLIYQHVQCRPDSAVGCRVDHLQWRLCNITHAIIVPAVETYTPMRQTKGLQVLKGR